MKKKTVTIIIINIILTTFLFYGCNKKEEEEGEFRYCIYTKSPEGFSIPAPETDMVTIPTPPYLYFYSVRKAYLYLFLLSPDRKIHQLFPYFANAFPRGYEQEEYILPEAGWDKLLMIPGEYQFHLLAATSRLKKIESLIFKYNTNRRAGDPGKENHRIYKQFYTEIQGYRKERLWVQNVEHRPFNQAGVIRSEEKPLDVTEITFRGIFIRSYTFNNDIDRNL